MSAWPTKKVNISRTTSSIAVPCAKIDLSSTIIGETKSDSLPLKDNDISLSSTPFPILDALLRESPKNSIEKPLTASVIIPRSNTSSNIFRYNELQVTQFKVNVLRQSF